MRRHAAANRERILEAAEAIFGVEGDRGSTEEVARRAGVGIATVFRHFPTKRALLEAVLVRHFDELDAQARTLVESTDPASALRRLMVVMVDTAASKITLASLVQEGGDLPADVRRAADTLRATVGTVLERACKAGAVHADVGVDEVYLLIRALADAGATAAADPATRDRALEVVLRGLSR